MQSSAADRIVALYDGHAGEWDESRGKTLFEREWLDRFLKIVPENAPILDIGCGSAEPIAAFLIGRGYEVTGIDSSPAMIAMCKARFPKQDWRVADMRTFSVDRRFGGLIAWDSFFHLGHDDQRRMFPVFRAAGLPGSALMFTSGPAHGEAIGDFCGEPLYHASLDSAEYEDLLGANGFEILSHVVEDQSCGGHTIWLARHRG